MSFDVNAVRADFPILSTTVNGRPLVYLDSGASAQKPRVVIDAITRAYEANTPMSIAACITCRTLRPTITNASAGSSHGS